MNRKAIVILLAFLMVAVTTNSALAYPVAYSLGLEELFKESEFVCKAVVISSQPVNDEWFEKVSGFHAQTTQLKIISVIKGEQDRKQVAFHHYAMNKDVAFMYMPQNYQFEVGRSYLVFAKITDKKEIVRQIWKSHRAQEDQGVFLCADQEPVVGTEIKEIVWKELTRLLKNDKTDDVTYALSHLDTMSGGGYDTLKDFDRKTVMDTVASLIDHKEPAIAKRAIAALATTNPYMSQDFAPGWLATIGDGDIPGFGEWDRKKENLGSTLYWQQLAAVGDGKAAADIRATAIRAMGRVAKPELLPYINRWARDPEPKVRAAAVVLLADFPDQADLELVKSLASDTASETRIGAAHSIGFGRFNSLIPTLEKLLNDPDAKVAEAGALSLLSFSLDQTRDILRANINHPEFRSLFVNSLGREDPVRYQAELCEVINKNLHPNQWWGGRIPWGQSWDILFRYAQSQSTEKLKSAELEKVLAALEKPGTGKHPDATYFSSSEPRDLYALYLQKGLKDRAQTFRTLCKKNITYDIDYYFNMVDGHSERYDRR